LSLSVAVASKLFRIYGGDDGARTRDLCRDSREETVTYWNQGERMAPFSALRNPR
jgi:hypothetical protein